MDNTRGKQRVRLLCLLTRRQRDEERLWRQQQTEVAFMEEQLQAVCGCTCGLVGVRAHVLGCAWGHLCNMWALGAHLSVRVHPVVDARTCQLFRDRPG